MSIKSENIGLVLSGGGFRALGFHLGALRWLADAGAWSKISYLSTVSGGSLAVGLLFAAIYLWKRNLAFVMIVHALADWSLLVLP